jgi:hypothetical protein
MWISGLRENRYLQEIRQELIRKMERGWDRQVARCVELKFFTRINNWDFSHGLTQMKQVRKILTLYRLYKSGAIFFADDKLKFVGHWSTSPSNRDVHTQSQRKVSLPLKE